MSIISERISAKFLYAPKTGKGHLQLIEAGISILKFPARSGSIDRDGTLKNFIPQQRYYLTDRPVMPADSELDKMVVRKDTGHGWKQRLELYPVPKGHDRTGSLLVHPDGGKGGSLGCLVTVGTNAMSWYFYMINHFENDGMIIPVDLVEV